MKIGGGVKIIDRAGTQQHQRQFFSARTPSSGGSWVLLIVFGIGLWAVFEYL